MCVLAKRKECRDYLLGRYMHMEIDELLEDFLGQLLEQYKQNMNENEKTKALCQKMIRKGKEIRSAGN